MTSAQHRARCDGELNMKSRNCGCDHEGALQRRQPAPALERQLDLPHPSARAPSGQHRAPAERATSRRPAELKISALRPARRQGSDLTGGNWGGRLPRPPAAGAAPAPRCSDQSEARPGNGGSAVRPAGQPAGGKRQACRSSDRQKVARRGKHGAWRRRGGLPSRAAHRTARLGRCEPAARGSTLPQCRS